MKNLKIISCLMLVALFGLNKTLHAAYTVGDRVKDFRLKNVDGTMVSLADFKGAKGVMVIFTCNHCPYAKAYEQRILELNNRYASSGYPVVAINPNDAVSYPDDSFEEMVKRSNEKKYTFPYLHDETQNVAREFGAIKTPHVYLLSKKGDIFVVEYIGAIDDNSEDASAVKTKFVENAITDLNANKKVSQNNTKAIGCSIKWKKAKQD